MLIIRFAGCRAVAYQLLLTFVGVTLLKKIDVGDDKECTVGADGRRQTVAGPRRLKRLHQAVLAVVDRAADAAYAIRWLVLHTKPELNAVGLSQVRVEVLKSAPDVNDMGMVRRFEPVDDPKALRPLI